MARDPHPRAGLSTLARAVAGECLALHTRRLGRVITRLYDEALRPHGLTAAQLGLLTGLTLMEDVSPAALGRLLDLEKSTLSRNLARMEANGWVRITRGDGGRGQQVRLRAAGEELLRAAFPAWQEAQRQARARLGSAGATALQRLAGPLPR